LHLSSIRQQVRRLLRAHCAQLRALLVADHCVFLPSLRALAPALARQLLRQASRIRLQAQLEALARARDGGVEESLLEEARACEREGKEWSAKLGEEEEEGDVVRQWIAQLR
jgi:enoyl-CoA hydratase/carnithine racemase